MRRLKAVEEKTDQVTEAVEDAEAAASEATTAAATATQAATDAVEALENVTEQAAQAQRDAQSALSTATAARTAANTAQTAAQRAQGTANGAAAQAQSASQNASTAVQRANAAQEAAEAAQGAEAVQAEQQTAEAAKPVQGRYKGAGAVRIAGGKQVKELGLSDEQYRAYKAAEIMAPALGTEIEINESLERDGKAVNGYYDPKTNTLKININAVRGGKKIALYTLGHESTHYVKANAPEQFGRLADFVEAQLGERWSTLTAEKRESLSKLNLLTGMSEEQIADLVREEVVADGMELILTDGKVLEELANQDKSLWETIKEWITETIAKIKEYYGQLNQASKTAQSAKAAQTTGKAVHLGRHLFIDLSQDIPECSDQQILQGLHVLRIHRIRIKLQRLYFSLSVHDDLHGTAAHGRNEFLLLQLLLLFFHLTLHFLRLLHQVVHISRHPAAVAPASLSHT
jgi:hypothetical protein